MRLILRFFLTLNLLLTPGLLTPPRSFAARSQPQQIPPSYLLVAQNPSFELYVDPSTLAFKLLDKRNNYIWHSGIDELQQGDRLNKSWRAFAQSGISIEYLDEKAVSKRLSITNAEHTLQIKPILQGVEAEVSFDGVGIRLQVRLLLEPEGVKVEVPFASIRQENPAFKLGLVYLYPFLGATRGNATAGYMFIPDGTGSLIRFADTTKARDMFYGRYYGEDLGMLGTTPYNPNINRPYPLSFPVFGMTHGEKQNAFLTVIEEGAAYAELQVHPAGILTNFNFLYNAFIYNQSYFQATNRSGAGVTTIQKQTNAFDAIVHYRFLNGSAADYVGMARSYQQYLLQKGWLHKTLEPNPNIGIRLEFLGGDKEKVLFWQRFIPMTTLRQVETILAGLRLANPQVIYFGWQPLGASSMPPLSLKLERSLGSPADLHALAEHLAANGGRFFLYLDPQAALWHESGYSTRRDLAMAITSVALEGYNRYHNYYFNLLALQQRYTLLTDSIASQVQAGLALDGIGFTLYSDFKDNPPLNRTQTIRAYQDLLTSSTLPLAFYRPNDYLWRTMSAYYDMPTGNNGYIYTSEAVPFLPIVLAGYVPYYGIALNFSPDLKEDILRHVEYGMYPSFFLTYETTAQMLNTPSTWLYTSSYEQWGEPIRRTYEWMNALLAPVRGQEIIAHQKIREGVFLTRYANDRQILVNYTDLPVTYQGVTVQAKDASLLEGTP